MNSRLAMDDKKIYTGRVGVIISTYNHPMWLKKTLWGYASQSYTDFEIIVADDGSFPETGEILEQAKEEMGLRIKHVWQPDLGFRKNKILNTAIQATDAEYLIFKDQDRVPRQDFVETHLYYARRVDKWHLELAHYLSKSGDDIQVLTKKGSELKKWASDKSLKIHSFSINSFFGPFKMLGLFLFFRREYPDVLIISHSKNLKIAGPAAKMAGISRIIYFKGNAFPIKKTFLNRYLFGHCLTDMLANSEETKKIILLNNSTFSPNEKIKVIDGANATLLEMRGNVNKEAILFKEFIHS